MISEQLKQYQLPSGGTELPKRVSQYVWQNAASQY